MSFRHCLALEMAALVAWSPAPARPAVVGVVEEADRVHLNNGVVSPGATVYDRDRFSSESGGMLLLHGNGAMLELEEESEVVGHSSANGAQGTAAELSKGTLVFSAARAAAVEVVALEAHFRPSADSKTMGQVSVTGPKELRICARHGALQFSYRGETETIAEGAAYRVILDPAQDDTGKKGPVKAARRQRTFLLVAIASAAAGAAIAASMHGDHGHKKMESPDRP